MKYDFFLNCFIAEKYTLMIPPFGREFILIASCEKSTKSVLFSHAVSVLHIDFRIGLLRKAVDAACSLRSVLLNLSSVMSLEMARRMPPEEIYSNRTVFCALFHWNSEQSSYYRKSIVNPGFLLNLSGSIPFSIT
jgi:hypothetical protein